MTSWIMTSPDRLADTDKASLDAILATSPELAAVTASVRAFAVIMNEKRGRKLLEPWMTAALATGEPALRSFVTGLRTDQDAVANGLSLPWSSGAVEGHVNRIILWNQIVKQSASPGSRHLVGLGISGGLLGGRVPVSSSGWQGLPPVWPIRWRRRCKTHQCWFAVSSALALPRLYFRPGRPSTSRLLRHEI